MTNQKSKTVFVGVSGGVDSSVSLALLKDQGFNVVGVFIKTWQPDFVECTWKDERRDAMRVCATLDVPFVTLDAEEDYKNAVGEYFINEYKLGRTPNPDVMCNKEIKFGVFLKFALERGADFVATGHYARILQSPTSNFQLLSGTDAEKDQSYFLWTLTKEELEKIIFPVGALKKTDVRKLATKYNLPTAEKKDSQGVCFLGPIDMKEFLSHYIPKKRGDVLDISGKVIGHHDGALFFTLGERHGFMITKKDSETKRLYVVARDLDKNTLTVATKMTRGSTSSPTEIRLSEVNWLMAPEKNKKYFAQVRYRGEFLPCSVTDSKIMFDEPVLVASGQSIVIYEGEVVVGGGIVA